MMVVDALGPLTGLDVVSHVTVGPNPVLDR
jgi:hypothetical protein